MIVLGGSTQPFANEIIFEISLRRLWIGGHQISANLYNRVAKMVDWLQIWLPMVVVRRWKVVLERWPKVSGGGDL